MTTNAEHVAYLGGENDGSDLHPGQRTALDRVRYQLASDAVWSTKGVDAKTRLLEAAALQPVQSPATLEQPEAVLQDAAEPISIHRKPRHKRHRPSARAATATTTTTAAAGRHGRWSRGVKVGSGVLAAAAMAAIGFASATQLSGASDGPETVASYELAATPLDPDATATADIRPTVAGVEIELRLTGLDNAEGTDYYSAWLMGDDEAIPLGSFHWRAGGVPIILWSGVDDPAYDTLMVTRQTQGDDGLRSDEVVLTGSVPRLPAEQCCRSPRLSALDDHGAVRSNITRPRAITADSDATGSAKPARLLSGSMSDTTTSADAPTASTPISPSRPQSRALTLYMDRRTSVAGSSSERMANSLFCHGCASPSRSVPNPKSTPAVLATAIESRPVETPHGSFRGSVPASRPWPPALP